MRLRFLEDIEKAGTSCKPFEGTRLYVDTGSVNRTSIDSSIEVSFSDKPSRANLCVKEGDVLFAKMQGTIKVLSIDATLARNVYSTGFYAFSDRRVLPGYLKHFFLSPWFNKEKDRLSNGATMKAINDDGMKKITLPCPSPDRQTEIVTELDSIESSIALAQRQISLLDEQVKSLFNEMFGSISERKPLLSFCDGKGQYGAQSASTQYVEGRPRYVRITDIEEDGSLNDDYVSSINLSDDTDYRLADGDFLFARMGATVGKTYYFHGGDLIFAGYLIRFQLNKRLIDPRFLFWFTKTAEYWDWVKTNQSGAAQPGINSKKYAELPIPAASIEKQKAFAERVQQIDKLRFNYQKQIDLLNELMEKKMEEYFGGEEDA